MSNFVTQSVESSVAILVFARPGPVLEQLRSQLQAKGLEVLVVDPLHFSQEEAALLEHQFFYKSCWVFDDSIKGTPQADEVFQFLFGRSEPVVIVTSTLGSEEVSEAWAEKKRGDTQLLQHFKRNIPNASVLVGVNWYDQPDIFVSPFSFFVDAATAVHRIKSGVQTRDVVDATVQRLVRPHQSGQEDLSKVRGFSEQEVLPFVVREPTAHDRPQRLQIDDPQPVIPVDVLELLEESSQAPQAPTAWYQGVDVYQELEDFEARHREHPVKVLPLASPRIPNRQRLYEQNMSRIKQRSEKQRLLRPVPKKVHLPNVPQPTQLQDHELQPLEKHLEVTIQQLFGSQRQIQRAERLEKKVLKTTRVKKKQVRQKKLMVVLAVLLSLGIIVGSLVGSFMMMRAALFSLILQNSSSGNLADQSVWQSWQTKTLVNALATEVQAYQYVAGPESLPETAAVVSAVRQMQTIHQQREELRQLADQSVAQVLGKAQGDVFETVTALGAQQQTLYSSLSLIQTQLQAVSTEFLSDDEQQAIEKLMGEIQQTRRQAATLDQVRQLLPAFLGQNERRRIAFVLLDSQELRPAGGVIEGVYLVTVEKGVVIDQQFFTSEQVEGDKSASLPAPEDYKKYLSPTTLPLTDAGWGPDFTDTAGLINTMLDHSLGRKADLVVGMTTNSIHEVIAQTGPLAIDGTKETLTDKNFYERIETHPDQNYLDTVFVSLLERVFKEPDQARKALGVLATELQTGQAFLVSAQPTENDVLNSLGWAGQISTPQCPSQLGSENCQISTIYQLESNVGLNKVGSLIDRKIQHTVQIGKDEIRHKRSLTLTNKAKTTRWPAGAYKDFIRFYLPNDAEIVMVRVGDKIIDVKDVTTSTEKGRAVTGVYAEVPVQSSVEVYLEYRQKFSYAPGVGFAFFDQKQAGTQPEEYQLIISPQDGLQAGVIAPKAELKNGQIIFAQKREKHQFVGVKFR